MWGARGRARRCRRANATACAPLITVCSSRHQIKGTVRCGDLESVPGLCSSPAAATPGVFHSAMAWDPGGTSGQREHATTSMGGGLCGQAQPGLPRQLASGSFPAGAVRPAGRRGYFPRRPANCFPTGWRRCVTKVVLAEQVAAHDAAFV